ncbi:MAG: NADH-quinone oxidoreductase subunit F [Chloroflexi bacterium]|nr:NADH-quinone oxidoreductase subunit F [Chloroflexota bacterium]
MTREEFQRLRQQLVGKYETTFSGEQPLLIVNVGECTIAKGVRALIAQAQAEVARRGADFTIKQVGCDGMCYAEPLVHVKRQGQPRITYGNVTPETLKTIIEQSLLGDDPLPKLALYTDADEPWQDIPPQRSLSFWEKQKRIVLEHIGLIDPESVQDYIGRGGYAAWEKALFDLTPEQIIEEMKTANVRGRGGAAFNAGIKWESGRATQNWPKYFICNGHEGEPNVFKDRKIMESDPHRVIEGIIIGAYCLGTPNAFIYIGAEFPLAIARIKYAIKEAEALGLLGDNVLGTGYSVRLKVRVGGGGYIAGEGSAQMYSIIGQRAMPRTKPPRSVEYGMWGKPTVLNNVETLSNVPAVVLNGGAWYAAMGTKDSPGTKVFSMSGRIKQPGVSELEFGPPLRYLLDGVSGGMQDGYQFKAIQTGGPSGGCIGEPDLDLALDYTALETVGGMIGSGGYVVFDHSNDAVELSRYFMEFNRLESCGKCTPCRLGTKAMLEVLERIQRGEGRADDLETLDYASKEVIELSLCGLGQTAPIPHLNLVRYFRSEFEAKIRAANPPLSLALSAD